MSAEADKVAIESRFKERYEMRLQFQEELYREKLQAKDGQILIYREQLELQRQDKMSLMDGIVKTMADKETNQTNIYADSIGFVNSGSGTITNFSQNIGNNIDDITKLINSLRDAAQTFPEEQREEALVHLEDLQEDLSKPEKQKPQRIKARLAALFAISTTVAGIVAASTDFSNNVLEISNKLGIELIQPHKQQLPPSGE